MRVKYVDIHIATLVVADKSLLSNMDLTEQDCALGDCFDIVLSDGVLKVNIGPSRLRINAR